MDGSWFWQEEVWWSSISVTLGMAMHRKNSEALWFLQAFGCTTPQQLPLITADWICTEQSGLHAFPRSRALIYRMVRGETKSHFTHIARKRPNTGLFSVSPSVLCFSMSERVLTLGFIHCVRWKGLVYSEHLYAISLCCFSPGKDTTPNFIRLTPRENYYRLNLSHLVVKLPHSLDNHQEPQNDHTDGSHTTCSACSILF